jgi:hypothetical protein
MFQPFDFVKTYSQFKRAVWYLNENVLLNCLLKQMVKLYVQHKKRTATASELTNATSTDQDHLLHL